MMKELPSIRTHKLSRHLLDQSSAGQCSCLFITQEDQIS